MLKNHSICLVILLGAVCVGGCGKKNAPAQNPPSAGQTEGTPAPPAAQQAAPTPAESYDTTVTARSIDYLRGQVARKNWPQVRLALSQLEARQLTPQQQQIVNGLKAQVPGGK